MAGRISYPDNGNLFEINIAPHRPKMLVVIYIFIFSVWSMLFYFNFIRENRLPDNGGIFMYMLPAGLLLIVAGALYQLFGVEKLFVRDGTLYVKKSIFGLGWKRAFPLNEISGVTEENDGTLGIRKRGLGWSYNRMPTVCFYCKGKKTAFGYNLTLAESGELTGKLKSVLGKKSEKMDLRNEGFVSVSNELDGVVCVARYKTNANTWFGLIALIVISAFFVTVFIMMSKARPDTFFLVMMTAVFSWNFLSYVRVFFTKTVLKANRKELTVTDDYIVYKYVVVYEESKIESLEPGNPNQSIFYKNSPVKLFGGGINMMYFGAKKTIAPMLDKAEAAAVIEKLNKAMGRVNP